MKDKESKKESKIKFSFDKLQAFVEAINRIDPTFEERLLEAKEKRAKQEADS